MITIVVPFFNRISQLKETLHSVKSQTFEDWECLLVDDGSTVENFELLKEYIKEDFRFSILKRSNDLLKGANSCRNIGIEKSKRKYIALLDSDDLWPSDYLEKSFIFAESHFEFSGSYGKCMVRDGEKERLSDSRAIKENESLFDFLLAPNTIAQTSTFFLTTEKAKSILFDENILRHQDWEFFIRFGKQYQWHYSPETYAIVVWEKGVKRTIDFASCIKVYDSHKDSVTNIHNLNNYLFSMYEKTLQYNSHKAFSSYYIKELNNNKFVPRNLREKIMYYFPSVYKQARKFLK